MPDTDARRSFAAPFSLNITEALRSQLTAAMRRLHPAPLTIENLAAVEARPGVYILLDEDGPTYIGKADKSLRSRLADHFRKLSGRTGNILGRIKFQCLYIEEDIAAIAPERMLIKGLAEVSALRWNNTGFGNNDPGKERDSSQVKHNHFDAQFPIDLTFRVALEPPADQPTIGDLMPELKRTMPFVFRYPKLDRETAALRVPREAFGVHTVEDAMQVLARNLPENWKIIALPGYVIAYPGVQPDAYPSRVGHWNAGADSSALVAHNPEFARPDFINPA